MKVADHTLLTPFIAADGRTGRLQQVTELLRMTTFPSLHQSCQGRRPAARLPPARRLQQPDYNWQRWLERSRQPLVVLPVVMLVVLPVVLPVMSVVMSPVIPPVEYSGGVE